MVEEDVSKVYLVTDLHFLHEKMQVYCNRPQDFNSKIVRVWQATVHPEDIVFNLGDVIWGNQDQLKSFMGQLPGTHILIRGNHDKSHSNNWFIQAGFSVVLEKVQISKVVLSHVPSFLSEKEIEEGIINVFGHFHNHGPDRWEPRYKERITPNHYLLSFEDVNYTPVCLEQVLKRKYVKSAYDMLKSENKSV